MTTSNFTVLFLGYSEKETKLIDFLKRKDCIVEQTAMPVEDASIYDLVLSFGYKHVLSENVINSAKREILNLHIGYLPYNRGAHPNFWSIVDGTPSGVTIHAVEKSIDTGPIAFQKLINFSQEENTFRKTYQRLFLELESLFIANFNAILKNELNYKAQRGKGSFHSSSDLPDCISSWDADIENTLILIDEFYKNEIENKLDLIDEIENVRKHNNVNWMDLLRLAFKSSPKDAAMLVRKINDDDTKISKLFKKLGS